MQVYKNTDKQTYIAEVYDGETGLMQFQTSDLFCFAHLLDMLHGLGCEQKSISLDSDHHLSPISQAFAFVEMQPVTNFDFDNICNNIAAEFDPEILQSGLFLCH